MTEQRKEFINEKEPQLHGDSKWYRNHMKGRLAHAYMRTDGSFDWPNSLEGDLLRLTRQLLVVLDQEESEPAQTFKVGEYYIFDDGKKIFKILCSTNDQIDYCVYDISYDTLKTWCIPQKDMVAIFPDSVEADTVEIALFKRAEHFQKHGRKLNEFEVFDFALVTKTRTVFRVKDVYSRNDVTFLGDHDAELEFPASECAIFRTAEEMEAAMEAKG